MLITAFDRPFDFGAVQNAFVNSENDKEPMQEQEQTFSLDSASESSSEERSQQEDDQVSFPQNGCTSAQPPSKI